MAHRRLLHQVHYFPGLGFAFTVAVVSSLVLGIALGVAGSVAAFKFMMWMKGKTLVFVPWPKIQSPGWVSNYYSSSSRYSIYVSPPPSCSDVEDVLHNPTYGLENTSSFDNSTHKPVTKRHQQPKPSQNSLSAESPVQEVYECVTEPINDAEINLDQDQFGLVPYAIHDFTEESQQLESQIGNVAAVGKGGPVVSSKANVSRKKGSKERRSMSESNKAKIATAKPSKPPTAKKMRNPLKPMVHAQTSSASTPQVPLQPQGTYSELDKKASYAILEPHIAEKGEEKALSQSESKETYRHLNY